MLVQHLGFCCFFGFVFPGRMRISAASIDDQDLDRTTSQTRSHETRCRLCSLPSVLPTSHHPLLTKDTRLLSKRASYGQSIIQVELRDFCSVLASPFSFPCFPHLKLETDRPQDVSPFTLPECQYLVSTIDIHVLIDKSLSRSTRWPMLSNQPPETHQKA
jgi:hypothetical protein